MNAWVQGLPPEKVERYISTHGATLLERYPVTDVYFAMWMHHLNRAIQSKLPLQFDDLEDWDFWAAYEGDMTPREAAEEMLAELGYDFLD